MNKIFFFLILLFSNSLMTQEIPKDSIERNDLIKIDPLVPSRAAFYSAVIPGLGQIYTKILETPSNIRGHWFVNIWF